MFNPRSRHTKDVKACTVMRVMKTFCNVILQGIHVKSEASVSLTHKRALLTKELCKVTLRGPSNIHDVMDDSRKLPLVLNAILGGINPKVN